MRSVQIFPFLIAVLAGCGTQQGASENKRGDSGNPSGVTVSLSNPAQDEAGGAEVLDDASIAMSELDLLLREIRDLRSHVLPEDAAEAIEQQRQINLQIIEIAKEIVARCGDDEFGRRLQNTALVEHFESRLQLAIDGSSDDVEQLYADVKAVSDSDSTSKSAAEGVYTLARFAHEMARRHGKKDLRWYENFSRWSREFANRFPDSDQRAIALLTGAAQSCELQATTRSDFGQAKRLVTEAKLCYTILSETYDQRDAATTGAAALRRLSLPGRSLTQFGGPTVNGQFLSSTVFKDSVTIIFFWDTTSNEFNDKLLPLLKQAEEAAGARVRFVGVNLDQEKATVVSYIAEKGVPGDQIFFPLANQRGWSNPLVRFWGITHSPEVWIVDANGVVFATNVGHQQLVARLKQVFSSRQATAE